MGSAGPTGPATIAVGAVTALEPGQTPTVVNTGTARDAILEFGTPRGATSAPEQRYRAAPGPARWPSGYEVFSQIKSHWATGTDTGIGKPPVPVSAPVIRGTHSVVSGTNQKPLLLSLWGDDDSCFFCGYKRDMKGSHEAISPPSIMG